MKKNIAVIFFIVFMGIVGQSYAAGPSIKVITPNNGETYTRGETFHTGDILNYRVKVDGVNVKGDTEYRLKRPDGIYLPVSGASGWDPMIAPIDDLGGMQLNTNIEPGQYYFVATWRGSDGLIMEDQSDKPITIKAGKSPVCSASYGTAQISVDKSSPKARTVKPGEKNVVLAVVNIKNVGSIDICGLDTIQIGERYQHDFIEDIRVIDTSTGKMVGGTLYTLTHYQDTLFGQVNPSPVMPIPAYKTKKFKIIGNIRDSATPGEVFAVGVTGVNYIGPGAMTSGYPAYGSPLTIYSKMPTKTEKILLMGGQKADGTALNDVWSSQNGTNWAQLVPSNSSASNWPPASEFDAVNFKGRLWVLLGQPKDTAYSRVWSSIDQGKTWEAAPDAPWPASNKVEAVVLDNKIFAYVPSYEGTDWVYGVWSSDDGYNWKKIASNTPWATSGGIERSGFTMEVLNNKIYLIGGGKNDVWVSTNGTKWKRITDNAPWGNRSNHTSVVFKDRIYIIGGTKGPGTPTMGDVWSSADGIRWTYMSDANPGIVWSEAVSFANKIYLIGGSLSVAYNDMNNVWSSTDGITWTEVVRDAPWPGRYGHKVIVLPSQ